MVVLWKPEGITKKERIQQVNNELFITFLFPFPQLMNIILMYQL